MDNEDIFKILVEKTCELLPELAEHTFQRSDSLEDLGASSLDRSEILVMTLETLDLNIPAVEFHGAENMGELTDMIHAKLVAV